MVGGDRASRRAPAFAGVGRTWWPAGDGPCYHRSTTGYREPPMSRARPQGAHHPHIPPAATAPPTTARRAYPSTTRPTTATPTPPTDTHASDTHSNGTAKAGETIGRVTAVGSRSTPESFRRSGVRQATTNLGTTLRVVRSRFRGLPGPVAAGPGRAVGGVRPRAAGSGPGPGRPWG